MGVGCELPLQESRDICATREERRTRVAPFFTERMSGLVGEFIVFQECLPRLPTESRHAA